MQKQLEQYLDSLEKPLSKLSVTERREWRQEAEQHLASLAAAHEELGADHEAALEAAIAQFGDAPRIARAMRSETTRSRFYVSPIQGLAGALVLQLVVAILGLVGLGVLAVIYIKGDGASDDVVSIGARALLAGSPLIGGALLGCNRHRWRLAPGATPPDRLTTFFSYLGIVVATLLICATDSVLWTLADFSRHGAPGIDARSIFVRLSLTVVSAAAGRAYDRTVRQTRMKPAVR
jgi:hypothetical protein